MVSRSFILLSLVALLVFFDVSVEAKRERPNEGSWGNDSGMSRERIIDSHKRRRAQLQKLLENTKNKLEDHASGASALADEEFETLSKRATLYERKLEKMTEEPDEKEIQRAMERDRMRSERLHREL